MKGLAGGAPFLVPSRLFWAHKPDRWGRRWDGQRQRVAGAAWWVAVMAGFSVGVWLVTFWRNGFRSDCYLSRPRSETSLALNVRPPLSPGCRKCISAGSRRVTPDRLLSPQKTHM